MAGLVKCRVCGKRVSAEAVREVKGANCCPPCYRKLTAKLKQKRSAPAAPEKPEAARPKRTGRPVSRSEKLAEKAMGYRGRGLAPDLPDMPDLPDLPVGSGSTRPGGSGFSIGPSSLGQGIFAALIGVALYLLYKFGLAVEGKPPGYVAIGCLGVAALFGFPAVFLGLMEAIKGGETVKQICGGIAIVVGGLLALGAGNSFYGTISKGPGITEVPDREEPDGKRKAPKKKPEPKPDPKEEPKPEPKPETKPGPKPEKTPEPEPKPRPKPKPKPKPKPRATLLTPRQLLRRKLRDLLPQAALEASRSQPALAGLSALRKEDILAIELKLDGGRATGRVETRRKRKTQRFAFVAEKKGDAWQVTTLALPESALKARRGADGKWNRVETPVEGPGKAK